MNREAGFTPPEPEEECDVPAVECTGIPYLQPNQTWIPGVLNWAPNRMPAAWINLRPGNYCTLTHGNFRGLQPWWYVHDDIPTYDGSTPAADAAFVTLETKLTEAYSHGFRRIILNLPAGMVFDQNMASSQWWSMPAWKRARLACLIQNWLASKPDTQFEIYGAFENNDPNSLCMRDNAYTVPSTAPYEKCPEDLGSNEGMFYPCFGANFAYTPSVLLQSHMCEFHQNIHPWQHLGITRYWLDWSNHLWDAYEEFPYSPLYRPGTDEHHFLGAESIPSVPVAQGVYEIDIPKVLLSPAIALNTMPTVNAQKQWDISAYAGSTELMALLDHSEDDYFKINHMFDVLSWAQKGFVLACQGVESIGAQPEGVSAKRMIEFMKRVYDFGPLADARDFNGDGVANQQDFNDFMLVYNLYLGRTNCNWVHGDVNGDNTVNMSDYQIFRARAMMTSAVPINLGSAEPYDALTKP